MKMKKGVSCRCLVCWCGVVRRGCILLALGLGFPVQRAGGVLASLQLAIITDGDREMTVSDCILISSNLSLSPPDKRVGLLAMMSSGRIWKVRVSYRLFLWHNSVTWPKGRGVFPYCCKREGDFDIKMSWLRVVRVL